eukprot:SAG31_NODE_1432_length_8373_cov_8.838289_2_plen_56_part_00
MLVEELSADHQRARLGTHDSLRRLSLNDVAGERGATEVFPTYPGDNPRVSRCSGP